MQWRFTSHGRGVMRYESAEACRVYRQDSFHDYLHRNSDTLSDDIANLLSLMRKETNTPYTIVNEP